MAFTPLFLGSIVFTLFAQGISPSPSAPALLTLTGRGAQVYRCDAATSAWMLDHPDADLIDNKGKIVGHHDAGPSWHYKDGSMVEGTAVEKANSPESGSIPWLVLRVTRHDGNGLLKDVVSIRRTETHGGMAPAKPCEASQSPAMLRVPYSATYTFYGSL